MTDLCNGYPAREYQRDSPSDLLLRRPQGIRPQKKIVKTRGSGLTRKNCIFFGSDHGGEWGALLYGLLGTCKLNGIDPEA